MGTARWADWTAATLDITADTAKQLVQATRLFVKHRIASFPLGDGEVTFDRALATARLADTAADTVTVIDSRRFDLAGVARLAARHRRITPREERQVFAERHLSLQPSLDGLSWRLWGELSGIDGDILHQAITARADQLRLLPHGQEATRAQLSADALLAIAQDSLTPSGDRRVEAASGPQVSIFIDAALAAQTNGQAGAEIAAGPRVGPEPLHSILCDGSVQVIGVADGKPVTASSNTRTIPPAIRRFVLYRDGGCTIAGCSSRYRSNPTRSCPTASAATRNLAEAAAAVSAGNCQRTRQRRVRIDPDSPPQQRRLLPPARDPPEQAAA